MRARPRRGGGDGGLRPGWVWAAPVALSIGLVLAAELFNGALEYLIDRIHPEIHDEIKFAKDAAAGAVLLTSLAAACVGAAMLIAEMALALRVGLRRSRA